MTVQYKTVYVKKKLLVACLLLAMANLQAQGTGEDDWGSWYMYFGMNRISERWSLHTEAQFRYYEQANNFNQLLLRTGMNYHIKDNAILTAGYAFIDTDPTFGEFQERFMDVMVENNNLKEHRIFQQFILQNKVWELSFEHRYRLEQRFLSNKDLDDNRTEHRARYRLQITLPLTNTFFINLYNEIFLNLQGNIFNQNRMYAAFGTHVTNNLNIQLGYLKNHFTGIDFDRVQIGVFYNPDLRGMFKKKS